MTEVLTTSRRSSSRSSARLHPRQGSRQGDVSDGQPTQAARRRGGTVSRRRPDDVDTDPLVGQPGLITVCLPQFHRRLDFAFRAVSCLEKHLNIVVETLLNLKILLLVIN